MASVLGLYSGSSTLAQVARASVASIGFAFGAIKLKYLKAKSHKKSEAAHH